MSLALLQNYTAVRNIGLSVPFGATGGTAPYAYSVVGGGAGGTINGSTGIYLSPINSTGIDQIVVTDSTSPTPLTASGSILVGTPIELVCDIFQNQLGLSVDQVWLYQQKVNIPSDSRSYVVVGVQSNKFFGNKPSYVGGSSTLTAVQSINVQQKLTVELFSRSLAPLVGVEYLSLALASPYAEQQMELNSFFVAPLPESAVNVGIVDGAAIPYHFQMRVNLQYASILQTNPDFFSSFGSPNIVTERATYGWNPSLLPGLVFGLDPTTGLTADQWNDGWSGNHNNFIAGETAPTTTTLNGQTVLNFSGGESLMQTAASVFVGKQTFTSLMVIKNNGNGGYGGWGATGGLYTSAGFFNISGLGFGIGGANFYPLGLVPTPSAAFVIVFQWTTESYDWSTALMRINGVSYTADPSSNQVGNNEFINVPLSPFCLNSQGNGAYNTNGEIGAWFMTNQANTIDDIEQLEAYVNGLFSPPIF